MLSALFVGLAPVISGHIALTDIKIYLSALIIGSLWPDLDEPQSFLGRKMYFISVFLSLFIKHRGITHTLVALLLYAFLGYLAYFYGGTYDVSPQTINYAIMGFLLGNIIHIMGDMSTKEGGIAILYPMIKKRFFLLPEQLRFKTGGLTENVLVVPILTAGVIWQATLLYKHLSLS
jgi:inner membrane protein